MVRPILRTVDTVSQAAAVLGGISLFAMSVLMLAEVFSRNFLGVSMVFSWEYSSYLMAAVFFLTAAYTLRVGGQVRVSLLAEALPAKLKWALEIVATAMACLISAFVTYAMTDLAYQSFVRGALTFLPSETPLWPPQAVVAAGAGLLTVQLAARIATLLIGDEPEIQLVENILPEEEL